MNAKEYLEQIRQLDYSINSKLSAITALKAVATKTTGNVSALHVSGSKDMQAREAVIARIIDLTAEVDADIDRLVDLRQEAQELIRKLDDPSCRTVLELRFVWLKQWGEVSEAVPCNLRTTYKIRDRGLEQLSSILSKLGT